MFRKIILLTVKTLLLSAIMFLVACTPRVGVVPGTIPAPSYPDMTARSQAKNMMSAFINHYGYTKTRDFTKQQRAEKVARKVLMAAGYKPGDFPVQVVNAGQEVNAMVLDGSSIIVFEELINRTTEEELAVVLAHETGHILGKHAAEHDEEKSREEAVGVASQIFGTIASVAVSAAGYNGLSDTAGSLAEGVSGSVGYGAFVGSYSRDQEFEADHIGLMVLAKAGYNPEAAIRLWSNEEKIFGSSSSSIGAFFGTHPAGSDRVEQLQEYLPLAKAYSVGKKKNNQI